MSEDRAVVITGIDERVEVETNRTGLSHPAHELLWNERGASTASVGPRVWTVTARIGLWVPAGTVHSVRLPAGTWYRAARFSVWATPKTPQWLRPFGVEITELLRLLLVRLSDTGLSPQSRSLNEQMVIDLLRPSEHEVAVHLPDAAVLLPMVEAVTARPADRHSLEEWAARLGVSGRTVGRTLRAHTGLGFTDWVASVRMQRAIELIVAGERLDDVAAEVGYRSPSAFGAAFKRASGLTPGAFRPDSPRDV
ncbi:AraC family transcriptional regulator [Actinotalea sp. K2]|uniref:helix-turn-helix domain-containing protein n=1 Tax=Actinotalea sp. K2 TaxID=2939438 RepID=UPI002016D832|nr:AraC family transcriptional regulator [Actinotalea sp. K2]MCL3861160.1 AraC family transcriptional regulator [Actinotalea sp. K2]